MGKLKLCSNCGNRHTARFGSCCKAMSILEGISRDYPKYVTWLEDLYPRSSREKEASDTELEELCAKSRKTEDVDGDGSNFVSVLRN